MHSEAQINPVHPCSITVSYYYYYIAMLAANPQNNSSEKGDK